MLNNILLAFWILIPAAVANTTPVIVARLPIIKNINYPIDFGATLRGKRVFGDHKTIRGLVCGMLAGIGVVFLQSYLFENIEKIEELIEFDYTLLNPLTFGLLLSFGALAGDAIESFFKRQLGVGPGKPWIPFDQIDSIIGVIIFTLPYYQFDLMIYVIMFLIWSLGHPLSTITGYLVKLKDEPI